MLKITEGAIVRPAFSFEGAIVRHTKNLEGAILRPDKKGWQFSEGAILRESQ